MDSGITAGLKWLAGVVEEDFEDLDARVERDIVQQKVLITREPPPRERASRLPVGPDIRTSTRMTRPRPRPRRRPPAKRG